MKKELQPMKTTEVQANNTQPIQSCFIWNSPMYPSNVNRTYSDQQQLQNSDGTFPAQSGDARGWTLYYLQEQSLSTWSI